MSLVKIKSKNDGYLISNLDEFLLKAICLCIKHDITLIDDSNLNLFKIINALDCDKCKLKVLSTIDDVYKLNILRELEYEVELCDTSIYTKISSSNRKIIPEKVIQDVKVTVKSMPFKKLATCVSDELDISIGSISLLKEECGFWHPDIDLFVSLDEIQDLRENGRVNSNGEVLWFWNRFELEEILIDSLIKKL